MDTWAPQEPRKSKRKSPSMPSDPSEDLQSVQAALTQVAVAMYWAGDVLGWESTILKSQHGPKPSEQRFD